MRDRETLYQEWIKYVFDRPDKGLEWYFDTECEAFQASNDELVDLASMTFVRSGKDLLQFTDSQVENGLSYIFHNTASDVVYAFLDKDVDENKRITAVDNIKILYKDCLAQRCKSALGHLNETASPPNLFCYMLWDTSPLACWKDVVMDVMEYALYLPNNACIESGLHGLGHRVYSSPEKVQKIIQTCLAKSKGIHPALRTYAMQAMTGQIQ